MGGGGGKAVISWPRIYKVKPSGRFGEKAVIQKGRTRGLDYERCIKRSTWEESCKHSKHFFFQLILLFWSLVWKYKAYVSPTAVTWERMAEQRMFVRTGCRASAELLAEIRTHLPPVSKFLLVLGTEIQEGQHNRVGVGKLKEEQHVEMLINNCDCTDADSTLGQIPAWLGNREARVGHLRVTTNHWGLPENTSWLMRMHFHHVCNTCT